MATTPPRILLLAEAANPEWTSVPLVGWSHAVALSHVVDVHLVTQVRNRDAVTRAGWRADRVTFIDSEAVAKPLNRAASWLRCGRNKGWTTVTAIQSIAYPYFEHLVWRAFRARLVAREFDLVHRITPLSPTMPSPIAAKVHRLGIPFVLGPLNGGVAWPKQFDGARRREREWLSYVRSAYKMLPGYRSTRKYAAAIICGSHATLEQMPEWCRDRCVYIPENAIDPGKFPEPGPKPPTNPLRVAFIGRLVPYKGADMLLAAAAPLIRSGNIELCIIGDGPERARLEEISRREGIGAGVDFAGWVRHDRLHERLAACHVLGFPSIREFGGGVVLEAMAQCLVPVVMNYGGPGELVTPETGIALPMGSRAEIVDRVRSALHELLQDPGRVMAMGKLGRQRVLQVFTWAAKAKQVCEVYRWALNERKRSN